MEPSSFIGVTWDVVRCFCGRMEREADFGCSLETNLQSLEGKRNELEDIKKDVEARIEEVENNPYIEISHQLLGWLQRVERIQQEIRDVEAQGARAIQNKCLSKWCSKNCISNYELGKNVVKMLKDVDELLTEGKSFGKDFIVAHNVPRKAIEMPPDETVGLDLMFNKVWNSIEAENNVGVIGLYGMGGVGKTTLLKKINNELGKRRVEFDFVMWVVVSNEPNLNSIMEHIRKLVGIGDHIWNRNSDGQHRSLDLWEKAAMIYGVLKGKKFVLLLDDIWESLDLKLVGVPHPKEINFKSKLLFTTRAEDVCAKMQAQMKFKVEILAEKEAFELFRMKVGEETLSSHPNIPKLAEKMAKECKGLPLALIVLGSAMAGVKSVGAWEHSINSLTSSSWTGPDLEAKVFSILKFSYDKLDEVQKRCFLYCALYQEDYEIQVLDLIDKWMWEKLLCKDVTMNVEDMRGYGESVIEKLKLSCLLESVEDDIFMKRTVKMHDVIHDMALWLMAQDEDDMELVQRISIINDWESQKILDPPNAATLVLVKEHSVNIIKRLMEDIKYMNRLTVLELNLDYGGGAFVDIGGLISLEYLSVHLRETFFGREFWYNLQSLTKLKFLSIDVFYLVAFDRSYIPSGVLSSLQQLRVLRLVGFEKRQERRILEELESLPNIEELWIKIRSEDGMNKLLESTKLQSCIYSLSIEGIHLEQIPSLLAYMSGMKQLHEICFRWLDNRSEKYSSSAVDTCSLDNLREVTLYECLVTHATWLKYAPLLQQLNIDTCESMKEVIKAEEGENNVDSSSVFSSLITLTLSDLPRLESIHKAPLPFPSLKSIRILFCPTLQKLPLDSNFAQHNKLTLIQGPQYWWDNLEWDNPAVKHICESKFEDWLHHRKHALQAYMPISSLS